MIQQQLASDMATKVMWLCWKKGKFTLVTQTVNHWEMFGHPGVSYLYLES